MQAVKDTISSALNSMNLGSSVTGNIGKIYSYPDNYRVIRAQAAAALNKCEIEICPVEMGKSNRTPEFLAKFPGGRVPAFEGTDGFCLSESTAIGYYVASLTNAGQLLGSTLREQAKIQQWIAWADQDLATNVNSIYYMYKGFIPYITQNESLAMMFIEKALDHLEKSLKTCTFLTGERITLADLTVASVLAQAFELVLGATERSRYTNVVRFYKTIAFRPELEKFFAGKPMCETVIKPQAPSKKSAEKKDKQPAAPKPKAAEKPKAAAKDDDEEEDDTPKEVVEKSPLDSLPKSTFDMNAWKAYYSNNDTRGNNGAIEYFYKHFDAEGYSVWRVDFKYNEELTQTFMSNNQIGGFFARLEASRKYLFGSMGVLGKPNDSVITGVFLARGQDIMIPITAAPDWESYSFKRIDLSSDEDKKFFEAALAWDLSIDGKEWADGKNFK